MSTHIALVEIDRTEDVLARITEQEFRWLSDSELARVSTLRIDSRRNHYLAGHWLARELLGQAFGGATSSWSLRERKSLPPKVINGDQQIKISISHSGDWIAAGVANVPIGIDIEQRERQLDASIESLLLNADEMPGNLDNDALLQRWVAKEAWLKAHAGTALPAQLKGLQLTPEPLEYAEVQIHIHENFHFALAIAPNIAVTLQGEFVISAGTSYRITN